MNQKLRLTLAFVMLASSTTFGSEPLGYFTDVRRVPGIDAGPWRDSVGSVSADQLEIYFTSDYGTRPQLDFGNIGPSLDVFVARRSSRNEPFGRRERLASNKPGVFDGNPIISQDQLQLVFDSARPGSNSDVDASWVITRPSVDAPWSEPVPATEHYPLNDSTSGFAELSMPSISPDGLSMVFVQTAGSNPDNEDLYAASRSSTAEPFTNIVHLKGVSRNGTRERHPDVSFDGKTMFFERIQFNFQFPKIQVAHRESTDEPFERSVGVDRFSLGTLSRTPHADAEKIELEAATFSPQISPDWPADGSKLYFGGTCCSTDWTIYEATWRQATPMLGDMTSDGVLDADDIDLVTKAVRMSVNAPGFDLNDDQVVDPLDREFWVRSLAKTWYGDANLDGEFNSSDLVAVFLAGQYEDGISNNSGWAEGDWNGDGESSSSDLVLAFQDGGYELGPRPAVSAVPEPNSILSLLAGWLVVTASHRQRRRSRAPRTRDR